MEAALNVHLNEVVKKTVEGRAKRGVEAFAEAMLVIPKTLAENSGYDAQAGSRSRLGRQGESLVPPYTRGSVSLSLSSLCNGERFRSFAKQRACG